MRNMVSQITGLFHDEDGATLVEYGIILVAIAVACIAAVQSIGGSTSHMFQNAGRPGIWNP